MSDFDPKDIQEEVSSDFDPADVHQKVKGIDKLESFQKGLEQGVTVGFGDELQGAIGSGMDASQALLNKLGIMDPSPTQVNADLASQGFTGDIGPQSTLDSYRDSRDSARKEYEQAAQTNPMMSLAGNIVGGGLTMSAAPAALMSPLGPAAEGAGLTARALQAARNAIPASAIAGLGVSDADISKGDLEGAAAQTVENTALGAGLAGALPVAGEAVKGVASKVGQSANKIEMVKDIVDAYKSGKQKLDLASPEFLVQGRDKLKDLASQADDYIREKSSGIFKQKEAALDQLEQTGVKTDVAEVMRNLADKAGSSNALRDEERQMLSNVVENQFKKGFTRSPRELEALLKDLQDLKANIQTPSGMKAVDTAVKNVKSIQDQLSPELQALNNQAFQTIEAGETLMKKNPLDYLTGKQDLQSRETLANMLEAYPADHKVKSTLDEILNKGLSTSKNSDILPLNQLVPEAAQSIESAKPVARQMQLAKQAQAPVFRGDNLFSSAVNASKTGSTYVANKAGLAVNKVSTASKNAKAFLSKGVSSLSDAQPAEISQLAEAMSTAGGEKGAQYAKVLTEASNKNPQSKNAIIFGLMQQPEFRELFHSVTNKDSGTEDGQ